MPVRTFRVLPFAALALPALLGAQAVARDTARVRAVVVTATRSPLAAERAPAAVTVLTGEQLRAEGISTVVDALRQVPGLALAQAGSYGGATSVFIRGGESRFAKVLVDGVPVNEAGGAFDFSALSTDNIDRIEVVRGPASVLYGSDAMAGVIQLFTRRGVSGVRGDLAARGGTFGSYDVDGSVRGGASAVDWSLGGGRHQSRGFQAFNSEYRDDVASGQLGWRAAGADARLTARYRDGVLHFPTDGNGAVVDSNAVRRESRLTLGLDAGYHLAPTVEARLALADHEVHGVTDDQPDSPGDVGGYYYTNADRSRRRSGDLRVNVDLATAARLTLGAAVEREWQEAGSVTSFGDTPTESRRRRSTGSYGQLLLAPTDASTLTLGARFEHNELFGDFTTWRAAGSMAVAAGTRVRASAGTAFREPTFIESYGCCGFVKGNPALTPEHALSFDAGVEHDLAPWATIGATLFSNTFRDLIEYQGGSGPNYVNVARTRSRGAELEARAGLATGPHASAAFTYLDARVADPGASTSAAASFPADARLLRRPMHTLDASVGVREALGALDVRALRVGTREDLYFGPPQYGRRVTLPAYTRVDLSGELDVPTALVAAPTALTLRVENLFDARYTEVAGDDYDFSATTGPVTGYRGAPRRVLVGARVAF